MKNLSCVSALNNKVSHSERIKAMIMNGLCLVSLALYMYSDYFDNKPYRSSSARGLKRATSMTILSIERWIRCSTLVSVTLFEKFALRVLKNTQH